MAERCITVPPRIWISGPGKLAGRTDLERGES
jgi:hypothetical protein